jgi:hypothetical protein
MLSQIRCQNESVRESMGIIMFYIYPYYLRPKIHVNDLMHGVDYQLVVILEMVLRSVNCRDNVYCRCVDFMGCAVQWLNEANLMLNSCIQVYEGNDDFALITLCFQ